jgi:hypothetical protein
LTESVPEQLDQGSPIDRMAPARAGKAKAIADGTLQPGWNRKSKAKIRNIRIPEGGDVLVTLPKVNGNSTWSRRLKDLLARP